MSNSVQNFAKMRAASLVSLLIAQAANADPTDLIGSGAWTRLHQGSQFDSGADTQANKAGTEIVGDTSHSSSFVNYDDNGTTSGPDPELDDILSLRLRIGDETKSTHSSYGFFGFDADADGKLEGFISSGAGSTAIWSAGTDLNISPSTTSISNSPHTSYSQGAGNYNFAAVSVANDPDGATNTDLNGDSNTDVFISLAIQVSDLDAFLLTQGITFTPATQLRFVALTATQTNSLNSDFNGVSDSGTSDWTQSFASLGMYSDPVDSTGVVDTTPPATPTVTSQITNDTTPAVSGTAEALSSVDVVINLITYPTTASAGGTWSVTVPSGNALLDGSYDVAVTSTDAAGNSSTDATSNELVIDRAAPATPTVTSQITNDTTPAVSGTAEALSSVDVVINLITYPTTASAGGTWSVIVPSGNALLDGSYDVAVTSTDAAGNSSTDATTNELVIDTIAPGVAITSAPPVNTTNATSYTVSGSCTDGDGNVMVGIGGGSPASQAVACAGNSWNATFDVSAIADGIDAIAVTAAQTDATGNTAVDTQSTNKDATAPTLTISDNGTGGDDSYTQAEAGTAIVGGTTDAENGQTVTVEFSDSVNPSVTTTAVVSGGSWTAAATDISALDPGTIVITADVIDAAGNPAVQASDTVTLTDAMPSLTADDVPSTNTSFPTFTGTTDQPASQIVAVSDGLGTELCTATPVTGAPLNTWSCTSTLPLSEGMHTYTATVSDALGNTQVVTFQVSIDFDADNDGLPDGVEGITDTDGDGLPDFQDPDSDNDGIGDADEDTGLPALGGNDTDNDGIDDAVDVDSTGGADVNGNGVDDLYEPSDLDGDGIADYLDTDSDNDGIPDVIEGNVDSDGDGVPDFKDTDSDNDGIPDVLEDTNTPSLLGVDSDADGIDDAIDVSSTGGIDLNGDGIDDALTSTDSDSDGIPDHVDPDSNNDGVPDAFGAPNTPVLRGSDSDADGIDDTIDVDNTGGVDLNADGIDDALGPRDSDRDGLPDYLEIDSDGDGIPDTVETGFTGVDTDGDGIDDAFDVDQTGGIDTDDDGIDDTAPPDFDNDGIRNLHDLDSDNDGVLDVIEAGLPDADGNGLVDDGSIINIPPDADGQGGPDYLDLDRDNDGTNDIIGTIAEPFDGDGDGQIDWASTADSDADGIPDVIDNTPNAIVDSDGDGITDDQDIDDDNDGIPDSIEAPNGIDQDTDFDGTGDRLDRDSDGDGIPDTIEGSGSSAGDLDADGVLDDLSDSNGDGLSDTIPQNMVPVDTDLDGTPDFRDLDSDADNLADSLENGDFDGDGILDYRKADGGLETAVTGSGAGSMDMLIIIILGGFLVLRRSKIGRPSLLLVLVAIGAGPLLGRAHASENCRPNSDSVQLACWYLSAGAGRTRVDPEGESNGWRTSDASSGGFKLQVGYHIKPRWFAELAHIDAGEAGLDNLNPNILGTPAITYDITSVFGGYLLRPLDAKWNLFGKAGISAIRNAATDARANFDKQTSFQLALGLGGEWQFRPRWFLRLELDSFDRDARYLGLAIGANLGEQY
jgi:hypothetical protein